MRWNPIGLAGLSSTLGAFLLIACGIDQSARPSPDRIEVQVDVPGPTVVVVEESTGGAGGAGGASSVSTEEPTECFFDEATGFYWEIKSQAQGHLRQESATYSWYMPEGVEPGFEGVEDAGECHGIECDTFSYVNAVNATFLCDFSDWRLPTTEELLSLPDLGSMGDDFPDDEAFYWTSDLDPDDPENAQVVYLCCGGIVAPAVKRGAGRILLVREDNSP